MSREEFPIENARVVGYEWKMKLAFVTEYEFSLVAEHEREDAIETGEERALFGDVKIADRFLLHSEAEREREVYEDDVEAEEISYIDGPTAPSEVTFWDDSRHFEDNQEIRTDGGMSSSDTYRSECECGWSVEHDWYGKVEERALEHMDDTGHSATQPEAISQ